MLLSSLFLLSYFLLFCLLLMWQLMGCPLMLPISEQIYFSIYETCCIQDMKLWKEPALYWFQFTSAFCCYYLIYFYTVSHLFILFDCMPKNKERQRGRERITLQWIVAQGAAAILSPALAPGFCFLCHPSLCCILQWALFQEMFLTLLRVSPTFCGHRLFCGTISTSTTKKILLLLWRLKIFFKKIEDFPRRLPRTWIYWTKLTSKVTAGLQLFQDSTDGKWFCCSVTRSLHSWPFLSINFYCRIFPVVYFLLYLLPCTWNSLSRLMIYYT